MTRRPATRSRSTAQSKRRSAGGVHVRQVARAADDGFRSPLVPGLKREDDARRLAEELAVATGPAGRARRPRRRACTPRWPAAPDAEEGLWLAFLIAYLGPLEDGDPFAGVAAARVPWAGGAAPELDGVPTGPRTAHDPARGTATPRGVPRLGRPGGIPGAGLRRRAELEPRAPLHAGVRAPVAAGLPPRGALRPARDHRPARPRGRARRRAAPGGIRPRHDHGQAGVRHRRPGAARAPSGGARRTPARCRWRRSTSRWRTSDARRASGCGSAPARAALDEAARDRALAALEL